MKRTEWAPGAKRALLVILSIVLSTLLIALIASTAYMERMLNLINKKNDDGSISREEYEQYLKEQAGTQDPDATGTTIDPNDVNLNLNEKPVESQSHILNIMLIGQDRRPGEGRTRSDVMVLCTLNKQTKELTLTSFMRDMYVAIPGYQADKMNAAYMFGGMKLLDQCMQKNFGVRVDGNLEVDFDGFKDVIDLMGGVDIYLSNSEANYMIAHGYSVFNGVNRLYGAEALFYARNRSIGNSDFTRTERQRKVLSALFEKCRNMSLPQLQELMEKALPLITTDLSNKQIMGYLVEIVPLLGDIKVNTNRIPADGTFTEPTIRGMSVLLPDLEANRAVLQDIMGSKE